MKHKIRDSIIFLIDILGIAALYRLYMRKHGPLVRVLCFHDVADVAWFDAVMNLLANNYNVITPAQFHAKEFDQLKINILLTFDDGYQSWIDNCLPILESHNFKGLFFTNSGLLDIASDEEKVATYMKERLLITPKKPLTWDGARELIEAGHSMGGHTVNHPNLAVLSNDETHQEIYDDKKRIESVLGIAAEDFAIPFGTQRHFNGDTISEIGKLGYTWHYSADPGFYQDQKTIPRVLIEKDQDSMSIQRWIEGGYDIFTFGK